MGEDGTLSSESLPMAAVTSVMGPARIWPTNQGLSKMILMGLGV